MNKSQSNDLYTAPHIGFILLADDDTDDCIFFKEVLEELSIQIQLIEVHDGEKLMQFLKNETNQIPYVLFLDLNMPRKNGVECLLEIKRDERLKYFPVIIISTSIEQEVVDHLYKNGAQYFVCKPPDFLKLKKMVEQVFTLVTQKTAKPDREKFVITV